MMLLSDDIRGDDEDDVSSADKDDNVIELAVPRFDPMVNGFMTLGPGQQLRLCWESLEFAESQHISPPSPGHLSEHPHTITPPVLKSNAPLPANSST